MNAPAITPSPGLPWRHALLALAVVAVWGTNFVVIKVALGELPPLLFAALRFTFALVPAAFFLKRPAVPWSHLAVYGLLIGTGQFGLLYIAMKGHISPGLASLVIQSQVFFTIGLSMRINRERVRPFQWVALALAVGGIVVIALHAGGGATTLGLVLVLVASMSWAGGNLVVQRSGDVSILAYVVWASLFSAPPLFVLSFLFEGWPAIHGALSHASAGAWAAVLWQSVGNTLFGYSAWGWLLKQHPSATVSPLALLVPVFGMAASAWLLAEPLPAWKLAAAALVLGGLSLNTWGRRLTWTARSR